MLPAPYSEPADTAVSVLDPDGGTGGGRRSGWTLPRTRAGLFNFVEHGLRPAPQAVTALVAESLATVLLGIAVFADRLRLGDAA
jgi:hypothetical protein